MDLNKHSMFNFWGLIIYDGTQYEVKYLKNGP